MTTDEIAEMIPDEVVEAAKKAYMQGDAHLTTNIRAALAAGLAAWPGAHRLSIPVTLESDEASDDLILPLKKESE